MKYLTIALALALCACPKGDDEDTTGDKPPSGKKDPGNSTTAADAKSDTKPEEVHAPKVAPSGRT